MNAARGEGRRAPILVGQQRIKLADKLKGLYESGATIRALVSVTGRSYGTIHRLLEEAGAQFRGRGGNRSADAKKRRATN